MAQGTDPETAEHAGLIFLLYLSHIGQTQVSHFCDGNAGTSRIRCWSAFGKLSLLTGVFVWSAI